MRRALKREVTSRHLKDAWAEFHDVLARTVRGKIPDKRELRDVGTLDFDVSHAMHVDRREYV